MPSAKNGIVSLSPPASLLKRVARCTGMDSAVPPMFTVEPSELRVGTCSTNAMRSASAKRRSRRRPTRPLGSRPESLQRRIDASLTRRNRAASLVFSFRSASIQLSVSTIHCSLLYLSLHSTVQYYGAQQVDHSGDVSPR